MYEGRDERRGMRAEVSQQYAKLATCPLLHRSFQQMHPCG